MAGITATGFTAKTQTEIEEEIRTELQSTISAGLDLQVDSPLGQIVSIIARQQAQTWELAQAAYAGRYRDTATGFSLDNIGAYTDTTRIGATKSTVNCTVNVDPGTYGIGTLIAHTVGNPNDRFTNTAVVTNGGGSAANFTDVPFEAEVAGPVIAFSGTLTVIAEPVTGWNSITNPLDAAVGANSEIDTRYRIRQETSLASTGSAPAASIRAQVLAITGVDACRVFQNVTDAIDSNSLPPHSLEVLVTGDTTALNNAENEIVTTILNNKAAGIQAYGQFGAVTVQDAQGVNQTINYSRTTQINIYLEVDLNMVNAQYGGDTAVQAALVSFSEAQYSNDDDVILSALSAEIFDKVAGVVDVTAIRVGIAPSPTQTTNWVIGPREIADFDTSRITVNSTAV